MGKKRRKEKEEIESLIGQGIVIRNTGSSYIVRLPDGRELTSRIKGNFRIKGIRTTNPVAVGDMVTLTQASDDACHISAIEPRRNYIIRRASNLSKESHILASNLDAAVLVVSLKDPFTPTTFIDRFLATAEAYSIPASIIVNKSDTWDDEEKELADALCFLYTSIGYKSICVSALNGDGLDNLRELTAGKITLMAGNSGVGKSSLINALVPNANLRTGQVSDIHHTGMHTTTFSEMLDLPYGGKIIDIPGVKGFGTIDFDATEVSHFFPEIFRQGCECKYSDCKHINEPGCAVIPAVEEHRIALSRYQSYLSILEEAEAEAGDDKYR
ncbi:MAG: ribosome small subunit-dependent GTPase A [Prevotella sp.]|nr:ribosome small subunit-dependent GTPase A [Bacteroides sp.]MCM1367074.1 ribosome small subunit-dependent GTPase A [Prevotella sp.]MCM1437544.1 ribosome small subunit-dependent GTPase A [Prevotella sp.]